MHLERPNPSTMMGHRPTISRPFKERQTDAAGAARLGAQPWLEPAAVGACRRRRGGQHCAGGHHRPRRRGGGAGRCTNNFRPAFVRLHVLSALASILPGDSLGGEVHADGSVEISTAIDAPQAEFYRIDVDTFGDRALALELFFRLLGTTEPLVIGGGEQPLCIDEEGEESVPVLPAIPGDAQGATELAFE